MSRSNWQFFGYCVLLYSAFALPWAFPHAAFSRGGEPEIETSRDVIEGELRVEMLEQQLREFLKLGGDRDTKEFHELFAHLVEARLTLAEARKGLIAERLGETKSRIAREVQTIKAKLQEQQAHVQAQVAKLHEEKKKLFQALQEAHRELEQRRRVSMPPLEKTETRVFHLQHINGNRLRNTLEEILGPDLLRLSTDISPQTLVVRAGEEALSRVETLIAKMDEPEVVSKAGNHSALPRSLMVRIFWLSDGQTYPDAQLAVEFLPDSVINALARIGIEDPFVVLQSNTSIALEEDEDEARFEVHDLPAIVFHERLLFNAQGEVRAAGGDRIRLRMEAAIFRQPGKERALYGQARKEHFDGSHISGSMIAPLEHFVVLGTANYASQTRDDLDVPGDDAYSSSRFAFVVQTIEAQSFAPEP